MRYRPLGKTGVHLSEIGIGAKNFVNPNTNKLDVERAEEIILAATQEGMNFIDLPGLFYNDPDLEQFVEDLRREHDLDLHLGYKSPITDLETFRARFFDSLRKTPNDQFEFYAIHGLTAAHENALDGIAADCIEFLFNEKRLGRVKYVGVSYHGSTPKKIFDRWDWDYAFVVHNPFEFESLKGKEISKKWDVGIVGMRCLKDEGFYRAVAEKMDMCQGDMSDFNLFLREQCLSWNMKQKHLSCALIGFRDKADVDVHMVMYEKAISDRIVFPFHRFVEESTLKVKTKQGKRKTPRCIGCGYCSMFCGPRVNPHRVFYNIPNNAEYEEEISRRIDHHPAVVLNCSGCRRCEKVCPQGIKLVSEIANSLRDWNRVSETIKKNLETRTLNNTLYHMILQSAKEGATK